jgi:hypothetical protein
LGYPSVPCYFTKGSRAQSSHHLLSPHHSPLRTLTRAPHSARKHRQTVIVTRAALVYSAAVCERPHSASASNPHERRSVATTQNTLPRSYLRLHVAARNSSQRCPPHQLTCVRTLTACAPAQRACASIPTRRSRKRNAAYRSISRCTKARSLCSPRTPAGC